MVDTPITVDEHWQIPPGWQGCLWRLLDAVLRHTVRCYWCMLLSCLGIVGFAVERFGFEFPFFRPFRAVVRSIGY